MIDQAQIRSVALYFFFSVLDEEWAQKATADFVLRSRRLFERGAPGRSVELIKVCEKIVSKMNLSQKIGNGHFSGKSGLIVPDGVLLERWRRFRHKADPQEFTAVLWSQVLGFSHSDLAEALAVSEGTIKYRVSRGLRFLSELEGSE